MSIAPTLPAVTRVLARHVPLYGWRKPVYQATLLRSLARIWHPGDRRLLDVGGGTGVMAQAIRELLPVDDVVSVDIEDRYLDTLTVRTLTYDGRSLPFADGAFDCVVLNNVLHHVPPPARAALMRECARVSGGGSIYIKDHIARSRLDHWRLRVLDWLGNIPFRGMLAAAYLEEPDWQRLAAETGYRIERCESDAYRARPFASLFPNRIEIAMRWTRPA